MGTSEWVDLEKSKTICLIRVMQTNFSAVITCTFTVLICIVISCCYLKYVVKHFIGNAYLSVQLLPMLAKCARI